MELDATIAKVDALCSRVEDLLSLMERAAVKKGGPYEKLRETHPNAGKAWSAADDDELRRLFAAGNAVEDLALLFGRTPNGVRVRLERLALTSPQAA